MRLALLFVVAAFVAGCGIGSSSPSAPDRAAAERVERNARREQPIAVPPEMERRDIQDEDQPHHVPMPE